jgi:elongation factor Ts
MAEITASMVKELREATGLGMMECKKALTEASGDLKKAEEILRIKSGAKASKVASRVAAEGTIAACVTGDGKSGALVEVNCETDFVAKDAGFTQFAREVAQVAAEHSVADVGALAAEKLAGGESVDAAHKR